jgi:hypothetical protein
MFHRRHFLKSAAVAIASLILPRSLLAGRPDKSFWFLHADTGDSWPISDPVQWSLQNAHEPILERATDGLLKLTPSDGDRIVRLVVRRCGLNLLEVHADQVVIHYWGQNGLADLRPFFKSHGLARPEIEVVVRDRKKEIITKQPGDDFLYGERLLPFWPLNVFWLNRYWKKWHRRYQEESNDWTAAPGTWSGFGWKGIEPNLIPWAALKSAWRRTTPMPCLNCDQPTIMTNFGLRPVGMLNRSPDFVHVCSKCCRSFTDESVRDVGAWIVKNLDVEVRPDAEIIWGRRVKWEPVSR